MRTKGKRRLKVRSILGTGLGLLTAFAAADAAAQTTPTESEELVVTATRREATVTDIPLAVNAYSGDTLENQGVSALQDLTKIDPTFAAQNYGASFNQYIIRGVSSEIGSTVGMYLDEAPVIGGSLTEQGGDGKPGLRMHDIARVEILRGPQGTLFGSSSMSGTVRVISQRPDYESFHGDWSASSEGIDGGNTLNMGDVAVNVPLIADRLAVRAVAWGEEGGGFIDQVTPNFNYGDVNDVSTVGGRISIGAQLSDNFSVLGMYVHQEIDVDGVQSWYLPNGPYTNSAPSTEPYGDQYDLAYLEGTYDMGFGTLLVAFSDTRQWVSRPGDTSPTANFFGIPGPSSFIQTQNFEATTGEVRFSSDYEGPFQLVAGAFYQDSTVSSDGTVVRGDTPTGILPCFSYTECTANGFTPEIVFSTLDAIDVKQYALYAQGDYDISDELTFTLGLRYYSADIRDYGLIQQDVFAVDPICSTFYVYRGYGPPFLCGYVFGDVTVPYDRGTTESSENQMSYNLSLLYQPNDDLSLYARAASGFRIGGVNN